MRGLVLFVAGILVGTAAQTTLAQNDAFVLNHVGLAVPDLTQAAAFYTEKLGYREAFRKSNPQGAPTAIYMQISRSTFLELQQANAERPVGLTHYGLHVDNMKSAVDRFRARGATVSDPTGPSAFSGAVLAQLTVPDGPRIELAELGPNSLQRKAMDGWK
jgi:catechol 2,3-dioxygenase-like lactoylglutathione lyase family enzyme